MCGLLKMDYQTHLTYQFHCTTDKLPIGQIKHTKLSQLSFIWHLHEKLFTSYYKLECLKAYKLLS